MNTLPLKLKKNLFAHYMQDNHLVATETIAPQSDGFGEKIQDVVNEIYIKSKELLSDSVLANIRSNIGDVHITVKDVIIKGGYDKTLSEIIFNRLGIRVKFNLDEFTHGAILTFPINDSSVLIHDNWKKADYYIRQRKIQQFKNKDKGTIDLEHARVGGIFSSYTHTMYISFGLNLFYENLTPGEVTAIMLHELGHAFTFYEYSNRLTAVNQVLANIAEELEKDAKKRDYTYIYTEMKNSLQIDEKDIDSILESKDESIIVGKLFTAVANYVIKENRIGKYEETAAEQLADQFAARFGYGRQLVLGLDKLMQKYSPDRNKGVKFYSYFLEIMAIVGLILIITTIIQAAAAGLILDTILFTLMKLGTVFSITMAIALSGDYTRNMTYDDLEFRYKRIRQDLIQQLKNHYYDAKESTKLIEDIKEIDGVIIQVKPYAGIFKTMMNIILPINYSTKKEIQYQQMVELLANNDLFLKAAELKQMA
jgi:hypothetical protein